MLKGEDPRITAKISSSNVLKEGEIKGSVDLSNDNGGGPSQPPLYKGSHVGHTDAQVDDRVREVMEHSYDDEDDEEDTKKFKHGSAVNDIGLNDDLSSRKQFKDPLKLLK